MDTNDRQGWCLGAGVFAIFSFLVMAGSMNCDTPGSIRFTAIIAGIAMGFCISILIYVANHG